jgi:predicted S18 family serine protease
MNKPSEKNAVSAVRTNDGFIEITSLELLDALVGGYINPEEIYCEVQDNDNSSQVKNTHQGVN